MNELELDPASLFQSDIAILTMNRADFVYQALTVTAIARSGQRRRRPLNFVHGHSQVALFTTSQCHYVRPGQTKDLITGIRGFPAPHSAFRDSMEVKYQGGFIAFPSSKHLDGADKNEADLSLPGTMHCYKNPHNSKNIQLPLPYSNSFYAYERYFTAR